MCVEHIYKDRYPDGSEISFRQTLLCKYGIMPSQPCQKFSTLENPVRRIQFGEPTTEDIITANKRSYPSRTGQTALERSWSTGRSDGSAEDEHDRRDQEGRINPISLKPNRQHRKERIIIVDSPPARRSAFASKAPRNFHEPINPRITQPFTTPTDDPPERARPQSGTRTRWDSPSPTRLDFDPRPRVNAKDVQRIEQERRRREHEELTTMLKVKRREQLVEQQNQEILRRPADPGLPRPLSVDEKVNVTRSDEAEEDALKRRREALDRLRLLFEEDGIEQRPQEWQMSKRRSVVGLEQRRRRVIYDDGVYNWPSNEGPVLSELQVARTPRPKDRALSNQRPTAYQTAQDHLWVEATKEEYDSSKIQTPKNLHNPMKLGPMGGYYEETHEERFRPESKASKGERSDSSAATGSGKGKQGSSPEREGKTSSDAAQNYRPLNKNGGQWFRGSTRYSGHVDGEYLTAVDDGSEPIHAPHATKTKYTDTFDDKTFEKKRTSLNTNLFQSGSGSTTANFLEGQRQINETRSEQQGDLTSKGEEVFRQDVEGMKFENRLDEDFKAVETASSGASTYTEPSLESLPRQPEYSGLDSPLSSTTNEQVLVGCETKSHQIISRSSSSESLQSLVDSIFSMATFSSASTAAGADDAFQRVLTILRSDTVLGDLYCKLVTKTSSGKFNRNFGTLLKRFALDLEKEAKCWNEQRAAQFIRGRARKIAEKISESVYPSESWSTQPRIENAEGSGESDSDSDEEPDEFQELEKFIIGSKAFQQLRVAFQTFLGLELSLTNINPDQRTSRLFAEMPFAEESDQLLHAQTTQIRQNGRYYQRKPWSWTNFNQNLRDLIVPERPVPEGMSRVRWTCACGDSLYDDYRELKPGAAKRMEDYLRRSSHKIHAGDAGSTTGSTSSTGTGIKSLVASMSSQIQSLRQGKKPELVQTELRFYSDGRATRAPAHTSGEVYYLLLCHNDGVGAEIVKLRQPDICDINTDQKLFSLLHDEYKLLRKRWWTWISLWTLQSIKFVRFELYENELVDVKKLDEVPPPTKDNEYRHGPPNPPELNPPLGSTLLMHLFKHPELAGTRKHCLKKIPRKLRDRLSIVDDENDPIGWGLQFIEGWSEKRLMYMTAVTFAFCSLIVMILVSVLGQNIQNAAAIASFMLSFVTIGIATAQAALHMS